MSRIGIISKSKVIDMDNFGSRLAELRQGCRLTQAELGKIIFVSSGTISNYEKGVHYPDVEKLVSLAKYFNVTVDYLLGRTASKLPPDVFEQMVSDNTSVGDIVQTIQQLSKDRKNAVCLTLSDMEISTLVQRSKKKDKK